MKPDKQNSSSPTLNAIELFAGVGGFRLGLEEAGWNVVWSNQWEPGVRMDKQHASKCYVAHFGSEGHTCEDISVVVERLKKDKRAVPDHSLLVGGFPCQDYSVAKPLSQAMGIEGKKGVLWWSIYEILKAKQPSFVLLENVDRLLKSPSTQRGRDFAVILSCLAQLGYVAEWRVVNAANYGFPQRRRRVFIYAHLLIEHGFRWRPVQRIYETGVFARALTVSSENHEDELRAEEFSPIERDRELHADPYVVSAQFGRDEKRSFFRNAGVMMEGKVWTREVCPVCEPGPSLGDIVAETGPVPEEFFISPDREGKWKELKGRKALKRIDPKTQFEYTYSEGKMRFPDAPELPSRTILTGEGGVSPSRFKHAVADPVSGRLRRLTPEELEALNGFERGWTRTGMPVGRRAFMMGNALVVGVVRRIAEQIVAEAHEYAKVQPPQE